MALSKAWFRLSSFTILRRHGPQTAGITLTLLHIYSDSTSSPPSRRFLVSLCLSNVHFSLWAIIVHYILLSVSYIHIKLMSISLTTTLFAGI